MHPQADGFTDHEVWDFADTDQSQYPLLLNFPYFDLYRKQVVKQADLVLALFRAGHEFTAEREAARLRVLRAADRPRLLAVGLRPGHHRGRDRPPGPGLRLLGRGRADGPRRPGAQHRATGCTSRRWPGRGWSPCTGSAGCATPRASCRSSRGCPAALRSLTFNLLFQGAHLNVAMHPQRGPLHLQLR